MPDPPGTERSFGVETIHLDLAPLAAVLGRRLREAGLPVTPQRAAEFARALTLVRPQSRRRLYSTARAVFVTDRAQIPAFDAVFAAVFGAQPPAEAPDPRARTVPAPPDERPATERERSAVDAAQGRRATVAAAPSRAVDEDEDVPEVDVPVAMASDEEVLAAKSFDALEPDELARLYRLMSRLRLETPVRRTRRFDRARRGEAVDTRRTLRASLRTAGEPVNLARRSRRIVPRRLVMLCDISGSMEPYARAYLQFLTCAAAAGPNAEAFVFATRLTRLTRALSARNPERAIQRAAAAAPDWSSGTRIGDALKQFNDRHGRRGMARGAVVVILSDGWERGDPAVVGREMERLARLAHRIVWVNPRVGASGFSVRAGGMVAALEHCDALVSGHSFEALGEVVEAIGAGASSGAAASLEPPAAAEDEEEDWPSATPVAGSSVAMPSGYGPSRGKTTPGWADR
ncbi:MAG TPA: VWA domain-containing protein [Solirubrobacterales bacterium]|nr:VWA domain-containing protein [Solirubrobacterales bacterium]